MTQKLANPTSPAPAHDRRADALPASGGSKRQFAVARHAARRATVSAR